MRQYLIIFIFFLICRDGLTQEYSFYNYSIEEGLSQSVVNCIFLDSKGYIWIGTQHGLNKFNGFTFETYTFNPSDTNSISNNWIFSIAEDKTGNLWVATKGGINEFIRNDKKFKRLQFVTGFPGNRIDYPYDVIVSGNGKVLINMSPVLVVYDPAKKQTKTYISKAAYDGSVKDNRIPLMEDAAGLIWIGSTRGLSCFDPATGKFSIFLHDPGDKNSISDNNITALYEDRAGNIWVGTSGGLNMFASSTQSFKRYVTQNRDPFALSNNFIRAITADKSGNIWIGTEGGGLNKMINPVGSKPVFEVFTSEKSGLSHNIVNVLKMDGSENLWIGTLKGISKADLKKQKFRLYRRSSSPYSVNLLGNVIASIFKDESGNIWIGNWGQGLNIFNRKTGEVEHFSSHQPKNHHLVNDFVHTIFEDSEKKIWIGTRDGIFIYRKVTNAFVPFREYFRNPLLPDFRGLRINKIIADNKKNYWVATQNGLYKFNFENGLTERFSVESEEDHRISGNLIYCIIEDRQGMIWIATLSGLDVYNPASGKFSHFKKIQNSVNSLSDNFVISLCADHDGNIWIGTGSSVNEFVKKDSVFHYFSHEQGLPNDQIFDILEDKSYHLWFATGSGLARLDKTTGVFRTYTMEEGLQSLEFNIRAAFLSSDGEVFFGGMNGFNSFYPDSLLDNSYLPEIVFTAFKKTSSQGKNESLDPGNMDEIVLNYSDYSFSIEFAGLEFTNPAKNKYAYMMEGISEEWIEIGNRRFVPFSNLPPGEYTFKVKGSNNDGVWNEKGKSLRIIIKPPWWKSNVAYVSYILVTLLLIALYTKWRLRKLVREKNLLEEKVSQRTIQIETQKDALLRSQEKLDLINKELELRVEERTSEYLKAKEKAESADRLKTAFMHNISHEIRTPLNGILGFGQMIMQEDQTWSEREKYLEILEQSSRRLMNTVNDYMDISLIVSGNMEIYFKPFAPADLLHDLFNRFSKPCELKGLELILQTPPKSATLVVRSDQELLGKILFHLTDNAVKFTRQGKITVGFRVGETALEFYVKDTGIGIDARDQELVFEHFVQADPMSSRANEGSGLGLSIAKGLVELLGGRIRMESVKGEGTAVYFTLPADPSYTDGKANREWIVETGHKPLILIAEDVESNSLLISQHLQKAGIDFLVVTDGQQAVEACRLHPLITLVLMDIKMPVMNGYEATREIKTFAPTLPVIALTAYAQSGDKKKALDAGCDDYLTKPVSKELLMDKIKKFQVWVI